MTLLKKYEWIFTNFREYGNCLLPTKLVKEYGVELLEQYFRTTYHDESIYIRIVKDKQKEKIKGIKRGNMYILERKKHD